MMLTMPTAKPYASASKAVAECSAAAFLEAMSRNATDRAVVASRAHHDEQLRKLNAAASETGVRIPTPTADALTQARAELAKIEAAATKLEQFAVAPSKTEFGAIEAIGARSRAGRLRNRAASIRQAITNYEEAVRKIAATPIAADISMIQADFVNGLAGRTSQFANIDATGPTPFTGMMLGEDLMAPMLRARKAHERATLDLIKTSLAAR